MSRMGIYDQLQNLDWGAIIGMKSQQSTLLQSKLYCWPWSSSPAPGIECFIEDHGIFFAF